MCMISSTTGDLGWNGIDAGVRKFDSPAIVQITSATPYYIEGKRSEGGGGLLVVFGNEIGGNGLYTSLGKTHYQNDRTIYDMWASSGGGSINIFANIISSNINMNADGENVGAGTWIGGKGSCNAGTINTGIYVSL